MQPEEMIGLWNSAPYDFGATESTALALLPDGTGWTAVTGPGPGSGSAEPPTTTSDAAAASMDATGAPSPARVRTLAWDCPKPEILEIRYDDYEFVRAQYTLRADALRLSQQVDSSRQFALSRREVTPADSPKETRTTETRETRSASS